MAPLIPAMKVAVCSPVPMRIVFESPGPPPLPISMLLLPLVRLSPAPDPSPRLLVPVLLASAPRSAPRPH